MQKDELKALVSKYFNLVDAKEETKQNFVEAELIDDTVVTNMLDTDFEVGQELHVITAEGEHVIAPSGEHVTKSGIILTVDGEGILTGVKHPEEEGEGSLEAKEEEMAAEETATEEKVELAEHPEDTMEEVVEETMEDGMDVKEAIIEAIGEVVAPEIEAMKQKMAEIEEKMKEYMSATPSAVPTAEAKFAKIQKVKNEGAKGLSFDAKAAQKDMILKAWKNKNK